MYCCELCNIEFGLKKQRDTHQSVCRFRQQISRTTLEVIGTLSMSEISDFVVRLIYRIDNQEMRIVNLERALRTRIKKVNRLETLPCPTLSYEKWKKTWPISLQTHFYYLFEHSLKECIYKMVEDISSGIENAIQAPFQCLEADFNKEVCYYYLKGKWHKLSATRILEDLLDQLLEWLVEWDALPSPTADAPEIWRQLPQQLYMHFSEKLRVNKLPKEWRLFVFEQFCRQET